VQVEASFLHSLSAQHLLATFGVAGVCVILFVQLGLLVGFFLPGDSLLFVAGYATVAGNSLHLHLPLGWLLIAAAGGAVAGGELGYLIGRRAGAELHTRQSRIYKAEYVDRAHRFLDRFGLAWAVVLSRFVPVVRTFTGPIIGVAELPAVSYAGWNLVAGILWTAPVILLGRWLGHISFIRKYVEVLALVIVVVSVVPALVHLRRSRRRSGVAPRS
jgi:membrane-associated protein